MKIQRHRLAVAHARRRRTACWVLACASAAAPAMADTFRIRWGATGYLQSGTSPGVCAAYGDARVAYSQNNPNDHNKWVFWDSMVAPPAVGTAPPSCTSIGNCALTLQAQSGYRERVFTNEEQCGAPCPPGTKWEGGAVNACVPIVNPTPPASDPPRDGDTCGGNPIYPLRGVKRETLATDARLGRLALRLTFDSTARAPGHSPDDLDPNAGPLGVLWSTSLHRRLVAQGAAGVVVGRGEGRVAGFAVQSGTFVAPAFSRDRLQAVSGGYRYVDAEARSIESYDAQGRLIGIAWESGGSVSLSYSDATTPPTVAPGPGYLIGATDAFGRSLSFIYGASGRLVQVLDAANRPAQVAYDTQGNLSTITWADSTLRQFHYEHASHPWALTGVSDEGGTRFSTFGYDASGRATSTEHAGGVGRFEASYSTPPAITTSDAYDPLRGVVVRSQSWVAPAGATLRNPLGVNDALSTTSIGTRTFLTGRSQAAGAGCAASVSAQSFDANGNLASRDDFNGHRVCYANDPARNLETVRVEGLAGGTACGVTATGSALPGGSRKTSTQWHPDWSLRTAVAEPGRITTYVYNGQPDPFAGGAVASCAPGAATLPDGKPLAVLCKQVEQATTDGNGALGFAAALQASVAAREQRWTYNGFGQVLTHDGPLPGAADTTSYVYHDTTAFTGTDPFAVGTTVGDLKQVINPAGHLTQYTKYDKAGRLLESVDPNGVISTHVWDLRGRLTSSTTAGLTTSREYWPSGLLKKVTQPDGSWILHGYDSAQRLTSISDNLGNSVTYTLDNLGNRTAEQVRDPGNVLRRSLGRSVDALGRIQQITGRE